LCTSFGTVSAANEPGNSTSAEYTAFDRE
jgi:hypothetical protein